MFHNILQCVSQDQTYTQLTVCLLSTGTYTDHLRDKHPGSWASHTVLKLQQLQLTPFLNPDTQECPQICNWPKPLLPSTQHTHTIQQSPLFPPPEHTSTSPQSLLVSLFPLVVFISVFTLLQMSGPYGLNFCISCCCLILLRVRFLLTQFSPAVSFCLQYPPYLPIISSVD